MTTTVECSDAYSSDGEFELSLSPLSSLEGASTSVDVANDRSSSQEGLGAEASEEEDEEEEEEEEDEEEEDEGSYQQHTSEERSQTTAASNETGADEGAGASNQTDDVRKGAGTSHASGDDDDDGAEPSASIKSGDDFEDDFCKESSCSSAGGPSVEIAATTVEIGEQQEDEPVPVQSESESRVVDEPAPVVLPCRTPKQVPGGCIDAIIIRSTVCAHDMFTLDAEDTKFPISLRALDSYHMMNGHTFSQGDIPMLSIWRRQRLSRDRNTPQNIPIWDRMAHDHVLLAALIEVSFVSGRLTLTGVPGSQEKGAGGLGGGKRPRRTKVPASRMWLTQECGIMCLLSYYRTVIPV